MCSVVIMVHLSCYDLQLLDTERSPSMYVTYTNAIPSTVNTSFIVPINNNGKQNY